MEFALVEPSEERGAAPPVTDIALWRALTIAAAVIGAMMAAYGWTIDWRSVGILVGAMLVVVAIGSSTTSPHAVPRSHAWTSASVS